VRDRHRSPDVDHPRLRHLRPGRAVGRRLPRRYAGQRHPGHRGVRGHRAVVLRADAGQAQGRPGPGVSRCRGGPRRHRGRTVRRALPGDRQRPGRGGLRGEMRRRAARRGTLRTPRPAHAGIRGLLPRGGRGAGRDGLPRCHAERRRSGDGALQPLPAGRLRRGRPRRRRRALRTARGRPPARRTRPARHVARPETWSGQDRLVVPWAGAGAVREAPKKQSQV
jgi:hypothetical protein